MPCLSSPCLPSSYLPLPCLPLLCLNLLCSSMLKHLAKRSGPFVSRVICMTHPNGARRRRRQGRQFDTWPLQVAGPAVARGTGEDDHLATWPLDSPLLPSWLALPRLPHLLPLSTRPLFTLHCPHFAVAFRLFASRFAAFCSFAFLIDFA